MKGEYVEDKHHTNAMFTHKLHHTHKFQPHHLHQSLQHQQQDLLHLSSSSAAAPHNFQLVPRECQTSEEADSRSPSRPTNSQPSTHDGASIEVVRRPRGRPPGSKNKPKPPVIITRDSEPSMSPYVLELQGGADIVDSISRFCRKRNTGLCVLTGSGTVANVTLRQPSTTPGATVTFHGRFDILSISATVILPTALSPSSPPFASGFTISLAGPQGQIVGGTVVGPLIAGGTVYVIAASFNNPVYHRLPSPEVEDHLRNSGSGGTEGHHSPSAVSGGGDGGHQPSDVMYSCHLPTDLIWTPTARQPQPPPY